MRFVHSELVPHNGDNRRNVRLLANLSRDLRFALRQMRQSPGFTTVAILTLALGIGANTAVFSLVEGVLLRPLPYQHPERLVVVWQADAAHRDSGAVFNTYREFQAWHEHSRSFEKLAAVTWATGPRAVLWQGKPVNLVAIPASVEFFSMLGVHAALGRTFAESDFQSPCTLVLAWHFWQQKLGGVRDILGRSLAMGKSSCQIVGIMAKDFSFYPVSTDAWMLITPTGEFAKKPWPTMVGAFGRLKPGVTRAAAEAELTTIQGQVMAEVPPDLKIMRNFAPDVLDLQSEFTWLAGRNLRRGLWLLLGASLVILIMASLNVGSLVLGRAMARGRETAIRAALGATRRRLVGQALTESLLLGAIGTAAGLGLAAGLLAWFRAANPIELPPEATVSLDWRVLLFTALCGFAASITFGVFPAWRSSRTDVNTALKSGDPNQGQTAATQRATQSMVVIQVALSMFLLAWAGLLSESLWRLATTDLGYRTDHLFTARIRLSADRYPDQAARSRFAEDLETRLTGLPGVRSVALGSGFVPGGQYPLSIAGRPGNTSTDIATQDVSPDVFRTLSIPLLRGRTFDARDRKDTQPVAIINDELRKEYFGDSDPLGRAIKLAPADDPSAPWLTVVGVVADVKTTTVFQEMTYLELPIVYRPLAQSTPPSLALMIAENRSPLALVSEIQQQLSAIDSDLVLGQIDGLREQQASELSQPRFRSFLFSGFAALALVLALVGLYGVLSQMVARRRREIGIRMALGADRDRILRAVLRHACTMTFIGILGGALAAEAGIRLIRAMLYGVNAGGAGELGLAAIALLVVTVAASWSPAWRAASIDPMRVLRDE